MKCAQPQPLTHRRLLASWKEAGAAGLGDRREDGWGLGGLQGPACLARAGGEEQRRGCDQRWGEL